MTSNEVMLVFWDAALKGALLLALAGLVTLALRRASAAVRHLVWSVAACGALLLPVLSFVLPEWRVPWVPDWRQPVLSASTGQGMPTRIPDALIPPRNEIPHVPAALGNVPPAAESGESSRPITLPVLRAIPVQPVQGGQFVRWLPAVWLTGAIASVLPLIIGWLQVLRLSRRSRPVTDPEWLEQLGTVADELGLRSRGESHDTDGSHCRVRLRISPHTKMPMTWGACRPILLLPADAGEWSPERRRVVLLHELAHVKRLDWFTQTLAYLACALYWFNPLVWFAARRMRIEREQACDDLVLRCGSRPSDYAVELLALATKIGGGGWVNWATVPMARRSSLEARLLSILDQKRSRTALTRLAVIAALALLAAIAVPVAMMKAAPEADSRKATQTTNGTNTNVLGSITGIVTDPQFKQALQAMEKRDGNKLVNGSTITANGPPTQIETTPEPARPFAATLQGRLVDPNNQPLGGRNIYLAGGLGPQSSLVFSSATTDESGRFRFEAVPSGPNWRFRVTDAGKDVLSHEFAFTNLHEWRIVLCLHPESDPIAAKLLAVAYSFDQSFLDYNGSVGMEALERLMTGRVSSEDGSSIVISAPRGAARFGPVIERELKPLADLGQEYLDLETGDFVTNAPPGDLTLLLGESDLRVRHGLEMVAVDVSSNRWDAKAEEVAAEVAKWTPQRQVRLGGPESRRTWFFRTREGTAGVLQVLPSENGAVKIRWRLVKFASDAGASRREEAPSERQNVEGGWQNEEATISARTYSAAQQITPSATDRSVITVTGTVVDAQTRQPIESFTVTPGRVGAPDLLWWTTNNAVMLRQGTYRVDLKFANDTGQNIFKIEAPGYLPTMTRMLRASTNLDFALHRGDGFQGTVVDPDGRAVAGAHVMYRLLYAPRIWLDNGKLIHRPSLFHRRPELEANSATTDARGVFSLPALAGAFLVVAAHSEGVVQVPVAPTNKTMTLRLQRWGSVEGRMRAGNQPLRHEFIMLEMVDWTDTTGFDTGFNTGFRLTPVDDASSGLSGLRKQTDVEGRFTFDLLPPGKFTLYFRRTGAPTNAPPGRFSGIIKAGQKSIVEVNAEDVPSDGIRSDEALSPNPQSAMASPARTNPQSSESLVTSAATEVPPLERKVSLNAHQMPLKDALAEVCRQAKVELDLDREAFEFEGQTVDRPVTALIVDEPLESAVATILGRLPWDHFIFQSLRGGKLRVSGHRLEQERTRRALPDWLRPFYIGGNVKLDDDHQVTAITVGGRADDEFLTRLKTLPKLRELRLDTTQWITSAGLAHLAEFPALEKLYLYYVSHAARVGNEALRVATRIKTLRDLSVGNCGVTDDGVRVLEGMTQLTALSLLDNPLTDASLKSLAGLTNLQRLDLGGTQITDTGLKQLSRLTELRELFVGRLPISDNALVLPHLRPLGRYLEVPETAVTHPLDARAILDAPGWGAAVEGFQVRLRAPEATVRAGKIPRLLVDIANQGSRQLQCIANSWCWELEVDGVPYLANGSRYPQASGYSESGGMLLDVLPGQPWANLPLVLNVAWRKASELGEIRDRFGGSGMVVPSNPQPLRLTPGKHTLRLTVVGLPKFAGSTGPVLAVSNPVEIEVLAEGAADKTQRELRDVTIRAAGGQVHLQLEDGTGITANEIKLAVTGVIRMDAPIHGEVIGGVGLRFGLPGIAHPESAISNEVSQGPLTIKASGSQLTIISGRDTFTTSSLHVSSGRLVETSSLPSAPESAASGNDLARPFVVTGRVTDEQGHGLEGVTIMANCGMGTLLPTGETKSDAEGRYTLRFREGMTTQRDGQRVVGVQAATISPRKAGFFETNLHRGGDLLMADKLHAPGENVGWKVDPAKVVLPNQPYELNFVMRPAATLEGRLVDPNSQPLAERKIYLTGDQLPPSSSVIASVTTDKDGRFRFEDAPTGFACKFSVTDVGKDVLSKEFVFREPIEHRVALSLHAKSAADAAKLRATSYRVVKEVGVNRIRVLDETAGSFNAIDDTPEIFLASFQDFTLRTHSKESLRSSRVEVFNCLYRGDTNVASDLFVLSLEFEREMKAPTGLERSYLDLEAGEFVTNAPPGDVTFLGGESDLRVRHGLNMMAVSVSSNRWDATEDEVVKDLANQTNQSQVRLGGTESQRTWFFKTREGSMGVLQILPVEAKPGTVVIRWKLVNPPTDPRSSRREEAPFPSSNSSESLVTSDATGMVAVSGSVLDAETHQPIERFTFKSGGPGDPDYLYWRKAQEGRHGAYQIELRYSDYVKVEAPGYMPEMIRIVRGATNQLTCNFELRKGESFVGKVVDWDGRPEAGAQLTFREDHGVFHLSGHKLVSHTFDSDYMWQNLIALSDSAGGFKLRAMPGVKSLVVLDEKGFAEVPRMGIAQGMTIRLQPWGKNAETAVALGLLVRLQTDRPKWRLGETPSLRLDIRNVGPGRFQSSTNTHLWRIEVDGEWYDSDQEIGLLQLEPGQAWTNRAVILDSAWTSVGKDGSTYMFGPDAKGLDATLYGADERGAWNSHPSWTSPPPGFLRPALRLSPGKHAIRLAVFAATVGDGTVGTIRALSNPVEIEMAAQNDSGSSRREQAPTAVEGDTERQRKARTKLGVFDAYYERKREELKANLDQTEAELNELINRLKTEGQTLTNAESQVSALSRKRDEQRRGYELYSEFFQKARLADAISMAEADLVRIQALRDKNLVSETTLREAQASLDLARAEASSDPKAATRVRLQQAESDLARLTELRNANLVSTSELEAAQSKLALLGAEAAGDSAAVGRLKVPHAEADLARVQELRDKKLVSETTLREAQAILDLARAEAAATGWGEPREGISVRLRTPTSNWSGDDQFLMIDLKTDGAEFSQNDSFGRWVVNGHNLVLEWDGQIFLLDPVSRQFAFTSAIARSKSLTNLAHLQFRPVAHEALALPDSLVQGRFAVRATSLADLQPMWGLVLRAYENRAFDLSAGKHTIRIGFPLKVQMISTTPPSLGRNWAWSRPVEIEVKE